MHGRTAFTGKRGLCGCYIGDDEFRSKLRRLAAELGIGRIVALYYRASTSYQITKRIGTSISEATMRPNPRQSSSSRTTGRGTPGACCSRRAWTPASRRRGEQTEDERPSEKETEDEQLGKG
jgi:hypothetical protein